MRYIVHHRYRGLAVTGERLNIPYRTTLETVEGFIIAPGGKPICYETSENAKRYFARNDDGQGLERGALTYAIAFSSRKKENGFRFSDGEIKVLERSWGHWLRQDVGTIIFNEAFFAAQPGDLRKLADALKIKVRR